MTEFKKAAVEGIDIFTVVSPPFKAPATPDSETAEAVLRNIQL